MRGSDSNSVVEELRSYMTTNEKQQNSEFGKDNQENEGNGQPQARIANDKLRRFKRQKTTFESCVLRDLSLGFLKLIK